MKIDKRLELEMRGKKSDQVVDLNLDNCRISCDGDLEVLTPEFIALESLSMINANISSLEHFPSLPNLRKLELSDNRISGGLDKLKGCTKLSQLSLSGNKIKDFSDLESLKSLKNLRSLDLFNCEVTNQEDYRTRVFEILDQITYLDGFDCHDNEVEEEDEDGEDMDGEGEDDDEDDDDDDDDEECDDEEGDEDDDEEEEDFDPDGDDDGEVVEEVDEEEDDDEDEDEDEEEDEAQQQIRGQKRKHDDDEEDDA